MQHYSILLTVPHAIFFITVTYLFYNWNFVPLNSLHPFHASPQTSPQTAKNLKKKKKKQSCRYHNPGFQDVLQSHSNLNSMVLTQR